ncbi:MAG: glycosyltransferase [Phycisphaera sp.]|nr:glycosyltransferase [Phycisphaera sp.]
MRFLILSTNYTAFITGLYAAHPGLERATFDEQLAVFNKAHFGLCDYYPRRLRELGHEAVELQIDCGPMQRAWAREHDFAVHGAGLWPWDFRPRRKFFPLTAPWFESLIEKQIAHYRPDVLLTHELKMLWPAFWRRVKKHTRLLVGQIASPYPKDLSFAHYDLMLSSLPNYVEDFRAMGVDSELFLIGFDPSVTEALRDDRGGPPERDIAVSFVGSLSPDHADRFRWLETLCHTLPELRVWGPMSPMVRSDSPIRKRHQGAAWGIDMHRILARSRITLNFHIGIAQNFANNMRLYEATGNGATLVTDHKDNLGELFAPGKEVVAYRDTDECLERVRFYLEHPNEQQHLAESGRRKTLADHTYLKRMEQLVEIVETRLTRGKQAR